MLYEKDIEKDLKKRFRKNPHQRRIIDKKLEKVRQNPYAHGEPLVGRWKGYYSVHIDSHFILIYSVDEEFHRINVVTYGKHDPTYGI
ncbi:MAG: type II toxin-antitoxin system mRNA interferase toxin, RelE/StbE family [Candidatus Aenigmarchaeota archaeon]|nr:type II toxin-antitoxin system mRNA interferase toxin, RelE/StbE family [Candidatus Aenigmarchaeota archaeon]